jgi:hypothetical protein
VKEKTLPRPGSLRTDRVPPISSTKCLVMLSPNPVPPYLRDVEASAWVNFSKIYACCFGKMPIPVSATEKVSAASLAAGSMGAVALTSRTISPFSVNLMALPEGIADDFQREIGLDVADQIKTLVAGPHAKYFANFFDKIAKMEGNGL